MQELKNFRLINVLCSVFETSFSAPDNFDYQSVPVLVQMKLDPYQLFSIRPCINFGLAKMFMKTYTFI